MEIGQQNIDGSEAVRWINKESRLARLRFNLPLFRADVRRQSIATRRCFQHSDDRCADSENALRIVDFICDFWRNGEAFGMHSMLGNLLRAHRQKCSLSHVKSYERVRDFV